MRAVEPATITGLLNRNEIDSGAASASCGMAMITRAAKIDSPTVKTMRVSIARDMISSMSAIVR